MSLSEYFMLALFILSVVSYIMLLFLRMHIINEVRREMNGMREEWKAEKYDRAQWQTKFEDEHQSPWHTKQKRSA